MNGHCLCIVAVFSRNLFETKTAERHVALFSLTIFPSSSTSRPNCVHTADVARFLEMSRGSVAILEIVRLGKRCSLDSVYKCSAACVMHLPVKQLEGLIMIVVNKQSASGRLIVYKNRTDCPTMHQKRPVLSSPQATCEDNICVHENLHPFRPKCFPQAL